MMRSITCRCVRMLFLMILMLGVNTAVQSQDSTSLFVELVVPSSEISTTGMEIADYQGNAVFNNTDNKLYISDGTESGTVEITSTAWSHSVNLNQTAFLDNELFFQAKFDSGTFDYHIFKTDGTVEGTVKAIDGEVAGFGFIRQFQVFGDRLAFIANSPEGIRLYLMDDTEPGGAAVIDIRRPEHMAEFDGDLYVAGADETSRYIYRINQAGEVSLAWEVTDTDSNNIPAYFNIYPSNYGLHFSAQDASGRLAFWKFDGESASVVLHPDDEFLSSYAFIETSDNYVFFHAHPWDSDLEDYRSYQRLVVMDAATSTVNVAWSAVLDDGWSPNESRDFTVAGDTYYFTSGSESGTDYHWWKLAPGSTTPELVEVNSEAMLWSITHTDAVRVETGAWISPDFYLVFTDGTSDGIFRLNSDESTFIRNMTAVGNLVWFTSDAGLFRVAEETLLDAPGPVVLAEPADGASIDLDTLEFHWESAEPQVTAYEFELAGDEGFSEIIADTVLADTALVLPMSGLEGDFWWRVRAENETGQGDYSTIRTLSRTPTSIDESATVPEVFALNQNYPNPFNPVTTISYDLPEAAEVTLEIYDVTGRLVDVLISGHQQPGRHQTRFDASSLSSGGYIYQIRAGGFLKSRKLMLVK
ncbi:MAG: T9SS type A sorting domain-containing protein [Balneolales bacterium]